MFRWSIRDLLWLTVVAAIGIGWWINHEKQNSRLQLIRAQLWPRAILLEKLDSRKTPQIARSGTGASQ